MSKERFELKGEIHGVTVKDKVIVYSGGPLELKDCKFENCEPVVEGVAANGLVFMKVMFDAGAKCSVMRTFLSEDEYEIVKRALGWEGKDGN